MSCHHWLRAVQVRRFSLCRAVRPVAGSAYPGRIHLSFCRDARLLGAAAAAVPVCRPWIAGARCASSGAGDAGTAESTTVVVETSGEADTKEKWTEESDHEEAEAARTAGATQPQLSEAERAALISGAVVSESDIVARGEPEEGTLETNEAVAEESITEPKTAESAEPATATTMDPAILTRAEFRILRKAGVMGKDELEKLQVGHLGFPHSGSLAHPASPAAAPSKPSQPSPAPRANPTAKPASPIPSLVPDPSVWISDRGHAVTRWEQSLPLVFGPSFRDRLSFADLCLFDEALAHRAADPSPYPSPSPSSSSSASPSKPHDSHKSHPQSASGLDYYLSEFISNPVTASRVKSFVHLLLFLQRMQVARRATQLQAEQGFDPERLRLPKVNRLRKLLSRCRLRFLDGLLLRVRGLEPGDLDTEGKAMAGPDGGKDVDEVVKAAMGECLGELGVHGVDEEVLEAFRERLEARREGEKEWNYE